MGCKRTSPGGGGRWGKKVKTTPVTEKSKSGRSGNGSGGGKVRVEGYEDEDEDDGEEPELEEGQEIAGRIYPAPKTGLGEYYLLLGSFEELLTWRSPARPDLT